MVTFILAKFQPFMCYGPLKALLPLPPLSLSPICFLSSMDPQEVALGVFGAQEHDGGVRLTPPAAVAAQFRFPGSSPPLPFSTLPPLFLQFK